MNNNDIEKFKELAITAEALSLLSEIFGQEEIEGFIFDQGYYTAKAEENAIMDTYDKNRYEELKIILKENT